MFKIQVKGEEKYVWKLSRNGNYAIGSKGGSSSYKSEKRALTGIKMAEKISPELAASLIVVAA